MKKLLFAAALVAFISLFISVMAALPGPKQALSNVSTVALGGRTVHVELATTPAAQERGLGGRTSLAPGTGMLFVFPQDGMYDFWMKDMRFPIDIIWMQSDGTVIYIVPDLAPDTYPHGYGPKTPARYVLEVPAGFAAAHHVQAGDRAIFR